MSDRPHVEGHEPVQDRADERGEAFRAVEQQVAVLARRIRTVVAERAALVDPRLTSGGYLALAHLRRSGPGRQGDLVDVLAVDKTVVSRVVQQLVGLGLVERGPDPTDGRAHRLRLTARATSALDRVDALRREQYARKLGGWTTGELEDLAAALARYNADVGGDQA